MNVKPTRIIAAIVAFALVGCQTPGSQVAKQSREQLVTATVCCKTIAEAKVRPVPQNANLELSATSQAFTFEDGKAFFEMFRLPPYTVPYSILIGSLTRGTRDDRSVMGLRVTLLDENFQPTRHFDESTLRQRGGVLERTVFVNPDNSAERYLVLYGSPIEKISSDTAGSVQAIQSGMAMLFIGTETGRSLHYSPTGMYFLRVDGLQLAQK